MITENLSTLKIHKLTQTQYERELAAGNIDANALYLTPDENIDLSHYATVEQLNLKADSNHNHNELYYTEFEIDAKLESKSDKTHNHDSFYDAKGSADEALASAKSYTDTKTSGLVSTSSVTTSIGTHNTSTTAHNDIRALITDLTAAAMPKSGGTFTGAVTAANDTAYTTYKVRNAAIVSATPSSMTNGTIAFVYS